MCEVSKTDAGGATKIKEKSEVGVKTEAGGEVLRQCTQQTVRGRAK